MYRRNRPSGISFSQCIEFTKPWLNFQLQNLELNRVRDSVLTRRKEKADRGRDRSRSRTPDTLSGRAGQDNGRNRNCSEPKARERSRTPRPTAITSPRSTFGATEPKYKEVKASYGPYQIWVGTTKRSGGKNLEICKDYNLKGKCPRGSDCKWVNCCDVIPKGKRAFRVCGSKSHTRQEHREDVWYA